MNALPRDSGRALRARAIRAARLARYGAEVLVVTVALWIPLCSISMLAMIRLLQQSPARPGGPTSTPSELPFVVCFLMLILANYLAQAIVKRLERFWAQRGW
jgi:hypothetical protein